MSQQGRRLLLRPGVGVVRRDAERLQVGIDPPAYRVLPDSVTTRELLEDLRHGRPTNPSPERESLRQAGLLVDADDLARDRRRTGPGAVAAYALFGQQAAGILSRRARGGVVLMDLSLDLAPLARLLADAGVGVVGAHSEDAAIRVLASSSPLPRAELDDLVRIGMPHLVIEGLGGRLRVGPMVVPGRTACLRCVDAHEAEADPRRPFLIEQLATDTTATAPSDPVLAALAAAWAARDLVGMLGQGEGVRPSTWSGTVMLGYDEPPLRQLWRRHPDCGCAWDVLP